MPDRSARLAAALSVAAVGPLACLLLLAGVVMADHAASASGDSPWQLLVPPFTIAAAWLYVAGAAALFISAEMMVFVGTSSARSRRAFALLPGGLTTCVVLDWAHPSANGLSSGEIALAALVPLLTWQALMHAWWVLANRLGQRNGRP